MIIPHHCWKPLLSANRMECIPHATTASTHRVWNLPLNPSTFLSCLSWDIRFYIEVTWAQARNSLKLPLLEEERNRSLQGSRILKLPQWGLLDDIHWRHERHQDIKMQPLVAKQDHLVQNTQKPTKITCKQNTHPTDFDTGISLIPLCRKEILGLLFTVALVIGKSC